MKSHFVVTVLHSQCGRKRIYKEMFGRLPVQCTNCDAVVEAFASSRSCIMYFWLYLKKCRLLFYRKCTRIVITIQTNSNVFC